MSVSFNAEEVYHMAEQIERNGIRFYNKAAEQVNDEAARQTLVYLAEMEASHERTFAAMRQEMNPSESSPETGEQDQEGLMYLQAAVEGRIFDFESDPAEQIGADAGMPEILRKAIALEHESVAFYTSMKQMMRSAADIQKIEHIISEELGHVTMLTDLMAGT